MEWVGKGWGRWGRDGVSGEGEGWVGEGICRTNVKLLPTPLSGWAKNW